MEKNWLIRTKNNHILGPVSKAKAKELVENGSIKGEDEVCSGNGFWFYVREKDLVNKYLFGEEDQPFNPVTEAESVLAPPSSRAYQEEAAQEESFDESLEEGDHFPSEQDLSYPPAPGEEDSEMAASASAADGGNKKKSDD
ncbi:MAG: hypothetical protein WEB87_02260 [Bacteriovoracaceae bacterium]